MEAAREEALDVEEATSNVKRAESKKAAQAAQAEQKAEKAQKTAERAIAADKETGVVAQYLEKAQELHGLERALDEAVKRQEIGRGHGESGKVFE